VDEARDALGRAVEAFASQRPEPTWIEALQCFAVLVHISLPEGGGPLVVPQAAVLTLSKAIADDMVECNGRARVDTFRLATDAYALSKALTTSYQAQRSADGTGFVLDEVAGQLPLPELAVALTQLLRAVNALGHDKASQTRNDVLCLMCALYAVRGDGHLLRAVDGCATPRATTSRRARNSSTCGATSCPC